MRSIFSGQDQRGGGGSSSKFRVLMGRRWCLSPLTLDDDDDDENNTGGAIVRPSISVVAHSYCKLPPCLLTLSVLKLDGTVFDVHVGRNDTVGDLKQAVEEVFTSSPKEGQGNISWTHVWSHFCLCYEGQRLINDQTPIRNFDIKDGDQLQFIRHMSINYSVSKRQSNKKHDGVACYPCLICFFELLIAFDIRLSSGLDVDEYTEQHHHNSNGIQECSSSIYYHHEDQEDIPAPEFKLSHFLRGRLSYSRLWGTSRKGLENRSWLAMLRRRAKVYTTSRLT